MVHGYFSCKYCYLDSLVSLPASCPTFEGRICNDHGVCTPTQTCECDEFFSGNKCQDTLAPGYFTSTGVVCGGHGDLSPYTVFGEIDPRCYNNWDSTACREYVKDVRKRADDDITRFGSIVAVTEAEIKSIPQCFCYPGFSGIDCTENSCPRNIENKVCSGNGNKTVGLIKNGTVGDGCQCESPLFLLDSFRTVSFDVSLQLKEYYFNSFAAGFCGQMYLVGTEGYYLQSKGYVCRCAEEYFGETCEFGVCPSFNEVTCSGGHPDYGFGVEKNTTRNDTNCHPICREHTCKNTGKCVPDERYCDVTIECPANKPYRCSNGACTAAPVSNTCASGYSYGWLDDVNSAVRPCNLPSCTGNESTNTSTGHLIPGGVLEFTSKVMFYKMRVEDGVTVELYEGTQLIGEHAPSTVNGAFFSGTIQRFIEEDVWLELYPVQVQASTDETWLIWPAPYNATFDLTPDAYDAIQLRQDGGLEVVLELYSTKVIFDEDSEWSLVRQADGLIVPPYGEPVGNDTCYENLEECFWNRITRKSWDGQKKICLANGVPTSLDLFACPNITLVEPVTTAMVGKTTSELIQMEAIDQDWRLWIFNENQTYEYRLVGGPVYDVSFVTVNDLRRPCTCIETATNQSTYNAHWVNQMKRTPPSEIGNPIVAKRIVSGDLQYIRGTSAVDHAPWSAFLKGYEDPVPVFDPKLLTAYEYGLGAEFCWPDVFPVRCPDGTCARLGSEETQVTVNCDCRGVYNAMTCTCVDPLTTFTCKCTNKDCICDNDDVPFATLLLDDLLQTLATTCVVTRVGSTQTPTLGVPSLTSSPTIASTPTASPVSIGVPVNYTFASVSSELPGFPREFKLAGGCTNSPRLFAKSRLFTDVFALVDSMSWCTPDSETILVPTYAFDTVYDTWIVETEMEFGPVEAFWSPFGVPVSFYTNITVTANYNQASTGNILYNSNETWSGKDFSEITMQFDKSTWLNAVYLNIVTAGIRRVDGVILPVKIHLYWSDDDGVSWNWFGAFITDAYNSMDTVVVLSETSVYANAILLETVFPIEIAVMSPITDQLCDIGRIDNYVDNVAVQTVRALERTNVSIPCRAVDTCVLQGVDVTNDGVCQDEVRFLGPIKEQELQYSNYWALDIMNKVVHGGEFAENYTNYQNLSSPLLPADTVIITEHVEPDLVVWYLPGQPCNLTSNLTLDEVTFQETCAWVRLSNVSFVDANGTFTQTFPSYGSVEENGYCPAGTDYTDCGTNNRYAPIDAGLSCLNVLVAEDIINRQAYFTDESDTIMQFLQNGAMFSYNTTGLVRTSLTLSRQGCNDCSGNVLCEDGGCSDDTCPATRFNCDGNGCVRADANSKEYKCVCPKGFGGIGCSVSDTFDYDPVRCTEDPALAHHAGHPPPLRIKPPYGFVQRQRFTQDLRELQAGPLITARIREDAAPYANVLQRWVELDGDVFCTTCPFLKQAPWGEPLTLEECVQEIDVDQNVLVWRNFTDLDGSIVQYIWQDRFTFDDLPFRCPKTGHCVAKRSDCANLEQIQPNCNGHGRSRADGTCDCDPGWRTHIFTDAFTRVHEVPYVVVNNEGDTNPTAWGVPNLNWKLWSNEWCMARDCTVVDCSPPMGCYPGTESLQFADAQLTCPESTPYEGMCAVDMQACSRGEVTMPLPCSGKGLLRRKAYVEVEEWYCECGDYVSDNATESTELTKNGWGGPKCDGYYCPFNLDPLIWFEKYDPITKTFHKDVFGDPLPGIWKGPCGAPVGPNPDDLNIWQNCCPGITRLELCPNVPCKIGGVTECTPLAECAGLYRKPLVYSCNGKGKARVDGTCECDTDLKIGGYTADYDRFSYDGCFRPISCPLSRRTGTPCNSQPSCGSEFESWTVPNIRYYEQQISTLFARMGLPPNNRTFTMTVAGGLGTIEQLKESAYVKLALEVIAAETALAGCVCVYPGENNTDTCCMIPDPGKNLQYKLGYNFPYALNLSIGILSDGKLWSGPYQVEGVNYEKLSYPSTFTIDLGDTFVVDGIRIHGKKEEPNGVDMVFDIRGSDNNLICELYPVSDVDLTADWQGTVHFCDSLYEDYEFERSAFALNCGANLYSDTCTTFQDMNCPYEISLPEDPQQFRGCLSRCCRLVVDGGRPTSSVKISYTPLTSNAEFNISFLADEIVIFGHKDQVLDLPILTKQELTNIQSDIGDCQDFNTIAGLLGTQGSYVVLTNWTEKRPEYPYLLPDDADAQCQLFGSRLATADTGDPLNRYAQDAGEACFIQTKDTTFQGCLVAGKDIRNYDGFPIDLFIKPSCTAWGCFAISPGRLFDIYSTPDILRDRAENTWGLQYMTIWQPDIQLDWLQASRRMMSEMLRQRSMVLQHFPMYKTRMATSTFYGSCGIGCIAHDPQRQVYVTRVFNNPHWVWWYPDSNRRRVANINRYYNETSGIAYPTRVSRGLIDRTRGYGVPERGPRLEGDYPILIANSSNEFNISNEALDEYRVRQDRIVDAAYWTPFQTSTGLKIKVRKQWSTVVDQYEIVNFPARNQREAALGFGAFAPNVESVTIPDGVIQTETWTNPKTCKVTFYNHNRCGQDVSATDPVWMRVTGARPRQRSYLMTPANDYHMLYKNLTWGNPLMRDCLLQDGTPCKAKDNTFCYDRQSGFLCDQLNYGLGPVGAAILLLYFKQGPFGLLIAFFVLLFQLSNAFLPSVIRPTEISNTKSMSIAVEGPCDLYAVSMNPANNRIFNGIEGEFVDALLDKPRMIPAKNFQAGAHIPIGCYAFLDRQRFTSFITYPRFRSAKIKTTIKARQNATGGASAFNMGWDTHKYMCSNVEAEIKATLGPYGSDLPGYGPNPFNRPTYSNPYPDLQTAQGNFTQEEWDSVDWGMYKALEDWLPGGAQTRIPKFFHNNKTGGILTNSTLGVETPFENCADYGRPVINCNSCPVELETGDWTWNQRVWKENFVTGVDVVDNRVATPVSPELHVMIDQKPISVVDYRRSAIAENARNMAYWLKSDYKSLFYLDLCLRVEQRDGFYVYAPTVCEARNHVLCERDVNKYLVRPGMQCDVCGPSAKAQGFAQPGLTCYGLFPLADASLYPDAHAIKNAYKAGNLQQFINTTDYDWDAARALLDSLNTSYIVALEEFYELFVTSTSTRPGKLSPNQVEDPVSWVDFDFRNAFPVSCGEVVDPLTGISRYMCAQSQDKCSYKYIDDGTEFPVEQYPTILRPVSADAVHTRIRFCGIIVFPEPYRIRDKFGAPSPDVDTNFIEALKDGTIVIQAKDTEATWRNTGKNSHGYTIVNGTTTFVYGRVECEACDTVIWMSSLRYDYGPPIDRINLASRTGTGILEATIDFELNQTYQIIGWDFSNLELGELITIEPVILSNNRTIDACQTSDFIQGWVNPPSVIESGQIVNECVVTEKRRKELNAPAVGQCYCKGRQFGGETCECLMVDGYEGKAVCGGWGETESLVQAPNGEIVSVSNDGCFFYGFAETACKCRDVGAIINVGRQPNQGKGYRFVVSVDRPRNTPAFRDVVVTDEILDIVDVALPLDKDDVLAICRSQAADLPSWTTSNEVQTFYNGFASDAKFVGLTIDNDQAIWESRAYTMVECISCVSTPVTVFSPGRLISMNWNNLVFNLTTSQSYDGLLEPYNVTVLTQTIYFPPKFSSNLQLRILMPSVVDTSIDATVAGWGACGNRVNGPTYVTLDCTVDPTGVSDGIDIYLNLAQVWWEVQLFYSYDTGRFY